MPIRADGGASGWAEENSLYAPIIEYTVMVMALDHFFEEVVEPNVPLETMEPWWVRKVIASQVNRYSRKWCLVFESLANLRERIEEQSIRHACVEIDGNLEAAYVNPRRGTSHPLTWDPQEP